MSMAALKNKKMNVLAREESKAAALQRQLAAQQELIRALKVVEAHGIPIGIASARKPARPRRHKPVKVARSAPPQLIKPRLPKIVARKLLARRHGHLTWTEGMWRVLQQQTAGISYNDLMAELLKGELGQNPSKGHKGFYQAIRRLSSSGDVVKIGGMLYTAKLANELRRKGAELPVIKPGAGRGGSRVLILKILNAHPPGLTAPEIKQMAAKDPDATESLRVHKHYVYNVLGQMKKDGQITHEGNIYRIASPSVATNVMH